IRGVGFSDSGLAHLQHLTRLKRLYLDDGNRQITDAGLKAVMGMADLEELYLASASLTDDGVGALRALKHLKILHVGVVANGRHRRGRWQGLLPGVSVE